MMLHFLQDDATIGLQSSQNKTDQLNANAVPQIPEPPVWAVLLQKPGAVVQYGCAKGAVAVVVTAG